MGTYEKRKERKRAEEALRRPEAEGTEAKLAEPENIFRKHSASSRDRKD